MSTAINQVQKNLDLAIKAGHELASACGLMQRYLEYMGLSEEFEEWAASQNPVFVTQNGEEDGESLHEGLLKMKEALNG